MIAKQFLVKGQRVCFFNPETKEFINGELTGDRAGILHRCWLVKGDNGTIYWAHEAALKIPN